MNNGVGVINNLIFFSTQDLKKKLLLNLYHSDYMQSTITFTTKKKTFSLAAVKGKWVDKLFNSYVLTHRFPVKHGFFFI